MTSTVYLVCGVPGSGKTWVCKQLYRLYTYVPHDEHIDGNLTLALVYEGRVARKPLLTECPFGERVLKNKLEAHGFTVIPVFIVEDVRTVKDRYRTRGRELPKSSATRAASIGQRADEWGSMKGTSEEVVNHLGEIARGK